MIYKEFFYKKNLSSKFMKSKYPDFSKMTPFILAEGNSVFCEYHNQWEKIIKRARHSVVSECGKELKGAVCSQSLPEEDGIEKYKNFRFSDKPMWSNVMIGNKKLSSIPDFWSKKKAFKFGTVVDSDIYHQYLFDIPLGEDCENIFAYSVVCDYEKFTIHLNCYAAKKNYFDEVQYEIIKDSNKPYRRFELKFSLEDGDINYYGNSQTLSKEIAGNVARNFEKMINKWSGMNVSYGLILKVMSFWKVLLNSLLNRTFGFLSKK